ncbi:hypothetical protein PMAG_a2030 [Pseudoalteromonas mariniglutinosa NCIMB 1770]|nr:hypothetical protein [Pseudoalteromonas mariniglutinosa NCIMB 1770]
MSVICTLVRDHVAVNVLATELVPHLLSVYQNFNYLGK